MSNSAKVSAEMNGPRCDCDPQLTVPCKPFIGGQHRRYSISDSCQRLPVSTRVIDYSTITLHNDLVGASNPDTAFTYSNLINTSP